MIIISIIIINNNDIIIIIIIIIIIYIMIFVMVSLNKLLMRYQSRWNAFIPWNICSRISLMVVSTHYSFRGI